MIKGFQFVLGVSKKSERFSKLHGIVRLWDFDKYGKIDPTAIYKNFPISKKTVEKCWPNLKEYVQDLNDT